MKYQKMKYVEKHGKKSARKLKAKPEKSTDFSGISSLQLEKELKREKDKITYLKTLKSTIFVLIFVAAIAILLSVGMFPVLRVVGSSMEPTLNNGQIVVALKTADFDTGDVVAFYYNNKILIKRVIALPGEMVNIDNEGNVYVNDEMLDEPYLIDKSIGECDITFPYQVPESRIFVMGDNRSVSVDSRSSEIGCISEEFIVGRVII